MYAVSEYISGYPLPLLLRNITEEQLWSVAVQMLALLNTIHKKMLFLRNFRPVTLLVQNGRLVTRAGAIDDFLVTDEKRETEEECTVCFLIVVSYLYIVGFIIVIDAVLSVVSCIVLFSLYLLFGWLVACVCMCVCMYMFVCVRHCLIGLGLWKVCFENLSETKSMLLVVV